MEGQALAGKGSLRGSEAWPLGRAERRSGEHRRCRGGLAAGGGGAGPRRRLSSAPLCLGLLPSSPVPYTLHPLLPLPPAASCFTSPPLGPQEPAAHGEDGGGSTGSSGCGIQYGGSESGRAAWRSAAPASAPPGDWTAWPGGRAETIERARARASPPGGSAPLARGRRGLGPPPPRSRPARERALQPRRACLEAAAKRCARRTTPQTAPQSHKFRKELCPRFCCFHADWPVYWSGWV